MGSIALRIRYEAELELVKAGEGSRLRASNLYEQWFRAKCAEGHPPDALRYYIAGEHERFLSKIAEGADHSYWTGGRDFLRNDGYQQAPARYMMEYYLGRKLNQIHEVVECSCRVPNCVRPAHLRIRPARHVRERFTESEAIEAMRAVYRKLGRVPSRDEVQAGALIMRPSAQTLSRLFGGWRAAWEAAGLDFVPKPRAPLYSDEEIFAALREAQRELGHRPSSEWWDKTHRRPSYDTIHYRFGGWGKAIEAAGL